MAWPSLPGDTKDKLKVKKQKRDTWCLSDFVVKIGEIRTFACPELVEGLVSVVLRQTSLLMRKNKP
jgi:hypothetical protein